MMKPSVAFFTFFIAALPLTAQDSATLKAVNTDQPQIRRLSVSEWPEDGSLELKGPLPSIIKVWRTDDPEKSPLEFGFNKDATEVIIYYPEKKPGEAKASLDFLITEKSTIHPDGTIVLSALDSQVIGKQAKLETHPGSHRIGFWGNAADFVRWDFTIPTGEYSVELVYSRATKTGTEIEIAISDKSLPFTLGHTGTWYRYRVVNPGLITIPRADTQRIETRVKKIVNGGVMNLKALVLTPVEKD